MNVLRCAVIVAAGCGMATPAFGGGFRGEYELQHWTNSEIADGITWIQPSPVEAAEFSYDVYVPGGVPFRTATFGVPAQGTGLVSFDWTYTGFHSWFMSEAVLFAFVEGPDGTEYVELYFGYGGPDFEHAGSAVLEVHAGYPFGIIVGGSNHDSAGIIRGTAVLSNFVGPKRHFDEGYVMENWSSSGIADGETSIEPPSGATETAAFGYVVNLGNPGPGVSFRTATFSVPSEGTGLVSFDWTYTGFHAWYMSVAMLMAFADGPDGTEHVELYVGYGGPDFEHAGSAVLEVHEGYPFGIIVGGSNDDSTSLIQGTVTLTNLVAPRRTMSGPYEPHLWSDSGIDDGTTEHGARLDPCDLAELGYDVRVPGSGGVPYREATFSVVAGASGLASFDWRYTGFHAWFMSYAYLAAFAEGPDGTNEQVLYDGYAGPDFDHAGVAAIEVHAGYPFGLVVGGSNVDSTSIIRGRVALSNFVAPEAIPCPGDVDDDGAVGFADVLAVLSSWGVCEACPADLDGDGDVGFTDLLAVLAAWGPCP